MTPSSAHSTEAASRCRLDAGVGSTGALSGGLLRRRITPGRPRVDGLSCASLHIRACKHTGLAEARRGAEPGLGRRAIVRKERLGAPGRPTSLLSARSAPACAAAARAETARGVEVQAGEGAPCGTRHVGRAGPVLEASGLRLRRLRAGNRKIKCETNFYSLRSSVSPTRRRPDSPRAGGLRLRRRRQGSARAVDGP